MTEVSDVSEKQIACRRGHVLLLAGILLLFIALRIAWLGHLLSWDEAMNLCSVRSYASGVQDYYSSWFGHHPPLLNVLMLLCRPLAMGFAERVEIVLLIISCVQLLVVFLLARYTFGVSAALWAAFFYAVLPAAIGYDVWIKQDILAALFGLLAVYAFIQKRPLLSGAFMGVAFLGKEMAMFYAIAIGWIWLLSPREDRRVRDALRFCGLTFLVGAWWYIGFSSTIRYFVAFAFGKEGGAPDLGLWLRPWHYYLVKLRVNLGWMGIGVAVCGLLGLGVCAVRGVSRSRSLHVAAFCWPLWLLLSAFLILSAAEGKACWFTTALFPVMAIVQGYGADALMRLLVRPLARFSRLTRRTVSVCLVMALSIYFTSLVWGRDYPRWFHEQDNWLAWGARSSAMTAKTLNAVVDEGESAMITPMFFWARKRSQAPCPIFVYYKDPFPVAVRPYDISLDEIIEVVRQHDLDWVMVSPMIGDPVKELTARLRGQYGIQPLVMPGSIIFPAAPLRKQRDEASAAQSER